MNMPEKYTRSHSHERVQAVERMKRDWQAQRDALAVVRRFNAANGTAWFWPKIAAALVSKHHWVVINCDSCDTVTDLDLRAKPRDPEASIRVALPALQWARQAAYRCAGAVAVNLGYCGEGSLKECRANVVTDCAAGMANYTSCKKVI